MQAKKEHPDYKKHQLCALIGVSNNYLKRVMKDLDIKSFYRHDIPVNKKRTKKTNQRSNNNKVAHDESKKVRARKKIEESTLTAGADTAGRATAISDEYINELIN